MILKCKFWQRFNISSVVEWRRAWLAHTDQGCSLITINFTKLDISVPWSEQIAHLKAAI